MDEAADTVDVPEATRLLLQSGESAAGLHCFLFGMYGSDDWSPRLHDEILWGDIVLTDVFGKTYGAKLGFRHRELAEIEAYFPSLKSFIIDNLDGEAA